MTGHSWSFEGIGTGWQIDTAEPVPPALREAVLGRVERFDADWSRFRAGSVVDRLRGGPGRHRMPADAAPLLDLYERLHRLTGGAMSPCVGDGLEHLGYDASYSLRPGEGHRAARDWAAVANWRAPYLTTTAPFVLDVGAAGKGYLVDLVAELIPGAVTVDAGGDLLHRSEEPLRVALEHPTRGGYAVGVAELAGGRSGGRALCASATNRRAWAPGVHHVLDARTGRPVEDVLATWVVADDARTADALATALFLVAPERLQDAFDFDFVRIDADLRAIASPHFPGELFT